MSHRVAVGAEGAVRNSRGIDSVYVLLCSVDCLAEREGHPHRLRRDGSASKVLGCSTELPLRRDIAERSEATGRSERRSNHPGSIRDVSGASLYEEVSPARVWGQDGRGCMRSSQDSGRRRSGERVIVDLDQRRIAGYPLGLLNAKEQSS